LIWPQILSKKDSDILALVRFRPGPPRNAKTTFGWFFVILILYKLIIENCMKNLFIAFAATLIICSLTGCLASTKSAVGVNCDYSKGQPLWEMPLDCQPGN